MENEFSHNGPLLYYVECVDRQAAESLEAAIAERNKRWLAKHPKSEARSMSKKRLKPRPYDGATAMDETNAKLNPATAIAAKPLERDEAEAVSGLIRQLVAKLATEPAPAGYAVDPSRYAVTLDDATYTDLEDAYYWLETVVHSHLSEKG